MKYFRTFSFICLLGLLYASCVKKENYPDIPAITYNSFTTYCDAVVPTKTDSAFLRVNFTDGNGDIGYPAGQEGVAPDFFIIPMNLNTLTGKYDTIVIPSSNTGNDTTLSFSYQIPNITPTGSDKELNGIIQINLENAISVITEVPIPNHNVNSLQFKVWMFDRAGNKSNVLITPANLHSCAYQ